MKILKFLTSRIGAISISAGKTAGMAVTVGLIGLNIYNYATNTSSAQQEKVRTLSSIMSSGGALPAEYSGINFDTGNTQFATAEEIAARQGTLFDGGEGAVNALNNLSVSSYALGAGEAGLGMGANAAAQIGADGQAVTGNVSADGTAVGAAAAQQAQQTQLNKSSAEKSGGLQRASMARASGSNLGSGNSGSFGASSRSAQGNASGSTKAAGVSEGYSLSGSMPKGSTLLAANSNVRGAASSSSSFIAGNARTRVGQGSNSREGRSLRDIALASAKVAANQNRAANEGGSPFMARERLAGGIQITGEAANEFAGSSDTSFEDNLKNRENAAGQAIDNIDTTEQERKSERTALASIMFSLLLATVGSCLLINSLMKGGVWSKVAAIAIGVIMVALIVAYIVKCGEYISKYNEQNGWAIAGIVMGVLMLAAIGISYVNFSSGEKETMANTVETQMSTDGTTAVTTGESATTSGGAAAGGGDSSFGKFMADMAKGSAPGSAIQAGGELVSGSGEETTGSK